MKILFNYASRSRPELFRRGVESIVNNAVGDYEILAIVDVNDERFMEYNFEGCTVLNGLSESKVHAINRGHDYILKSGCDIIVNMSDDMVFTKKGFDGTIHRNLIQDIRSWKTENGVNGVVEYNLDQCLHFHDGNRGDLITMSILGIDYYKRFNYIYNPEYKSLYCDNEQTEVAIKLGCYKYVNENIFVHLHPAYGKAVFDSQYQHTESFGNEDYQTYLKRKSINYGL